MGECLCDDGYLCKEHLAEAAQRNRLAMLRLGATDADFEACGVTPPTPEERDRARAEGWPT